MLHLQADLALAGLRLFGRRLAYDRAGRWAEDVDIGVKEDCRTAHGRGRDRVAQHGDPDFAPFGVAGRIDDVHDQRGAIGSGDDIVLVHGIALDPVDGEGMLGRARLMTRECADAIPTRFETARDGATDGAGQAKDQRDRQSNGRAVSRGGKCGHGLLPSLICRDSGPGARSNKLPKFFGPIYVFV